MVDVGTHTAESGHVLFGVAIVENAYDEPAIVEAVAPGEFRARDAALLETYKGWMPRLPVEDVDVLVVDRMGKNYSGTGMDTNVLGRFRIYGEDEPDAPRVKYVVVGDLTEESHGNALGIGLADIATERLLARIEYGATYENILTSTFLERAKVPLIRPNDRAAIEAAIRCNWGVAPEDTRLVRIPNTLHLDVVHVSRSLAGEVRERDDVEVVGDPFPLRFDDDGNLCPFDSDAAHAPLRGPWEEIDAAA
jgi:hypothetical protein